MLRTPRTSWAADVRTWSILDAAVERRYGQSNISGFSSEMNEKNYEMIDKPTEPLTDLKVQRSEEVPFETNSSLPKSCPDLTPPGSGGGAIRGTAINRD